MIRKEGGETIVLGVAFRGATISRPPGLGGYQPGRISAVNHNNMNVSVLKGKSRHIRKASSIYFLFELR